MARFGSTPIPLAKGVDIKVSGSEIKVKGDKGELRLELPNGLSLQTEGDLVKVIADEKVTLPKAFHGLYRSMINNMIVGVSKGFEKILTLIGVGYRANVSGKKIDLQLGFSHPTAIEIPNGIQVSIEKGVEITIKGCDKQLVGEFAAKVRAMKPPEPYKGKGIRYKEEYVRKKAGKAAATAATAKG